MFPECAAPARSGLLDNILQWCQVTCSDPSLSKEIRDLRFKRTTLEERLDPFFELSKLICGRVNFHGLENYLSCHRERFPTDLSELEENFPWTLNYRSLLLGPVQFEDLEALLPAGVPLSVFLSFISKWRPKPDVFAISPSLKPVFREFRLLSEYGLALRGNAIPVRKLLTWFDLEDLQRCTKRLFGRAAFAPRKHELIEVLAEEPKTITWVYERILKKRRKLDWYFILQEAPFDIPSAQIAHAKAYLNYLSELWRLFRATRTNMCSLGEMRPKIRQVIHAKRCCIPCWEFSKREKSLPPFHPGCTCQVQ